MASSSGTQPKRVRVANFTVDEKALLVQLIKNNPIIESKMSDGKSILKKKTTWDLITAEFNCHAHVNKRDTLTLKRAWDNIKAFARKARSTERGNLIRTGGGPFPPPQPPQQGAIRSLVEEAAPNIVCEIMNDYDSDGIILKNISQDFDLTQNILDGEENVNIENMFSVYNNTNSCNGQENIRIDPDNASISTTVNPCFDMPLITSKDQDTSCASTSTVIPCFDEKQIADKEIWNGLNALSSQFPKQPEQHVRRISDYTRREAVLRIKYLQMQEKIKMQISKTKLETQEIQKRTALFQEEKAKLELEELKSKLANKN